MNNTRLMNEYIEQEIERTKEVSNYIDTPIKDNDTIILPKYVPLSTGWHLIDIKAFDTRTFDSGKTALCMVFVLYEDETETEHKQTLWKYQLSLLREVKQAKAENKAHSLYGKIWCLFAEQVSEKNNKVYIVAKAFAKKNPEEEI